MRLCAMGFSCSDIGGLLTKGFGAAVELRMEPLFWSSAASGHVAAIGLIQAVIRPEEPGPKSLLLNGMPIFSPRDQCRPSQSITMTAVGKEGEKLSFD